MSGLGTSTHHCSLQLSCFYCIIYLYFLTQTKHQKHLYKLDVYSNTSTYLILSCILITLLTF